MAIGPTRMVNSNCEPLVLDPSKLLVGTRAEDKPALTARIKKAGLRPLVEVYDDESQSGFGLKVDEGPHCVWVAEPAELPADVSGACPLLPRDLDLPLCGIGLRRTPEGIWACFEVNPSPAVTCYPVGGEQTVADAVADLLLTGATRSDGLQADFETLERLPEAASRGNVIQQENPTVNPSI